MVCPLMVDLSCSKGGQGEPLKEGPYAEMIPCDLANGVYAITDALAERMIAEPWRWERLLQSWKYLVKGTISPGGYLSSGSLDADFQFITGKTHALEGKERG